MFPGMTMMARDRNTSELAGFSMAIERKGKSQKVFLQAEFFLHATYFTESDPKQEFPQVQVIYWSERS